MDSGIHEGVRPDAEDRTRQDDERDDREGQAGADASERRLWPPQRTAL